MRKSALLFAFMFVTILFSTPILAQNDFALLTTIGRGEIQDVQWYPDGESILVSTPLGAWIYTAELQDRGHIPDAHMATLSPDGRLIAGVDNNYSLRLWNAETFALTEKMFRGYSVDRRIFSLEWSPDGRYLAIFSQGNDPFATVEIWDSANPNEFYFSVGTEADVFSWSPSGTYLAVLNTETTFLEVFQPPNGEAIFHSEVGGSYIGWKNDQEILSSQWSEFVNTYLWDVSTGELVNESVTSGLTTYSPNGEFYTIPNYSTLQIYVTDSDVVGSFTTGDHAALGRVVWKSDSSLVATGSADFESNAQAEIFILDPIMANLVQRFPAGYGGVSRLIWNEGKNRLLATDSRNQLFTYDLNTMESIGQTANHTLVSGTLAWSPDSSQIAIADSMTNFHIWTREAELVADYTTGYNFQIRKIQWHTGGELITTQQGAGFIASFPETEISLWYAQNTSAERAFPIPTAFPTLVVSFEWSPDGSQLAAFAQDTLYVWNTLNEQVSEIALPSSTCCVGVEWSPSGRFIALPTYEPHRGGAYVYDTQSNAFIYGGVSHNNAARGQWITGDEYILLKLDNSWVTYDENFQTPAIISLAPPDFLDSTVTHIVELTGLTHQTVSGFLSPYGSYAAAIDDMGSGFVWDAETGDPLFMLADTANIVWSPDETRLVVQRNDGSRWILNANGGIVGQLPLSPSLQEPHGTFFWSPDGTKLAYLYLGVVEIWAIA